MLARKAVLDQVMEEARLDFVELRQQELAILAQLGSHEVPESDVPSPDALLQLAAARLQPASQAPGKLTSALAVPFLLKSDLSRVLLVSYRLEGHVLCDAECAAASQGECHAPASSGPHLLAL